MAKEYSLYDTDSLRCVDTWFMAKWLSFGKNACKLEKNSYSLVVRHVILTMLITATLWYIFFKYSLSELIFFLLDHQ